MAVVVSASRRPRTWRSRALAPLRALIFFSAFFFLARALDSLFLLARSLVDSTPTQMKDTGANFFLFPSDVEAGVARAVASVPRLQVDQRRNKKSQKKKLPQKPAPREKSARKNLFFWARRSSLDSFFFLPSVFFFPSFFLFRS